MASRPSSVAIRYPDGSVSDRELHEEILAAVDDKPLRIRSAQRAMAMGMTRAEAETLFKVKLSRADDKTE